MDAKKVALFTCGFLLLVLLLDFSSRLLWSEDSSSNTQTQAKQNDSEPGQGASSLNVEEVEKLLAWSDVKPTPEELAAKAAAQAKAQQANKPPPPPPPKVDVHKQVQEAIAGDVSKKLLGDNLLTLKGLFYDKSNFAVVEVENIVTKKKQYFRVRLNESFDSNQLVAIGKNHVSIKNGDQTIRLQMFEGTI